VFQFTLKTVPIYIAASAETPKEVRNLAGGKVYHKAEPDVDSGDTELAEGGTVQITEGKYFVAASVSEIGVKELKTSTVEDLTTVDDLTVGDDLSVAGDATVTGTANLDGTIDHDGAKVGFFATAPAARPKVAKKEGEEKKATVAELQEALETLGLIEEEA